MAKHRKTRAEKIRSDLRSQKVFTSVSNATPTPESETLEKPSSTYSLSAVHSTNVVQNTKLTKTAVANSYQVVKKDLLRTGIITGCIVVAEIILFTAMR